MCSCKYSGWHNLCLYNKNPHSEAIPPRYLLNPLHLLQESMPRLGPPLSMHPRHLLPRRFHRLVEHLHRDPSSPSHIVEPRTHRLSQRRQAVAFFAWERPVISRPLHAWRHVVLPDWMRFRKRFAEVLDVAELDVEDLFHQAGCAAHSFEGFGHGFVCVRDFHVAGCRVAPDSSDDLESVKH